MQRQHGLTLLELLVVLVIIGFASIGVSLALRDSNQRQLEREAQRLVAVLEAARAQSRTSGMTLIWHATPDGFDITSQPPQAHMPTSHQRWLQAGTHAYVSVSGPSNNLSPTPEGQVVLGPEPIIAPAQIVLSVATAPNTPAQTLNIGTDGLRPFQVLP